MLNLNFSLAQQEVLQWLTLSWEESNHDFCTSAGTAHSASVLPGWEPFCRIVHCCDGAVRESLRLAGAGVRAARV